MADGDDRSGPGPRLIELRIADEPTAWAAAGFTVDREVVRISGVDLRLTGRSNEGERGITGWTIEGIEVADGLLDGLPTDRRSDVSSRTHSGGSSTSPTDGERHPNGVIGLDHVVVLTPDLERTIDACTAAGLDLRRIREGPGGNGIEVRQAFFRLGSTILEVVSGDVGIGLPATDAPATWFGIAVDVEDLDETATFLGDGLGRIKPAVQPGRRIATLRHQQFGMSVAIAAMDHHGDR